MAELVDTETCSIIGLAEVWRQSPLDLIPEPSRSHWRSIHSAADHDLRYDVALVYDSRVLTATNFVWLRATYDSRAVKPGLVVTFDSEHGPLVIAIAHWATDVGDSDHARGRRQRAAEALRHELGPAAFQGLPVLVMGDLNLEPFDQSLTAFPTSRAREIVRRHRARESSDTLFYNAAWRWLGERHACGFAETFPSLAGTYRNASHTSTAWRTFDHVIVSASLLGTTGWRLKEDALGIWTGDRVFNSRASMLHRPFDHLPIVGALGWRADSVEAPLGDVVI
jgi:Endonuclease/Exonuclease/phosphatase family